MMSTSITIPQVLAAFTLTRTGKICLFALCLCCCCCLMSECRSPLRSKRILFSKLRDACGHGQDQKEKQCSVTLPKPFIDSALLEQHHHASVPTSQAYQTFVCCKQARGQRAESTAAGTTRTYRRSLPQMDTPSTLYIGKAGGKAAT
jgi:hypothetical protein